MLTNDKFVFSPPLPLLKELKFVSPLMDISCGTQQSCDLISDLHHLFSNITSEVLIKNNSNMLHRFGLLISASRIITSNPFQFNSAHAKLPSTTMTRLNATKSGARTALDGELLTVLYRLSCDRLFPSFDICAHRLT